MRANVDQFFHVFGAGAKRRAASHHMARMYQNVNKLDMMLFREFLINLDRCVDHRDALRVRDDLIRDVNQALFLLLTR